jgi:hypothetical protein
MKITVSRANRASRRSSPTKRHYPLITPPSASGARRPNESNAANVPPSRSTARRCPCGAGQLVPDAKFQGYEDVVVQDIIIRIDNVLFHKEVFYSPSEQKAIAPLPRDYVGAFGPGVKALVLYSGCLMSEAKIHELLVNVGVQIAEGTLSNLLQQVFHTEQAAVYTAGLRSSSW